MNPKFLYGGEILIIDLNDQKVVKRPTSSYAKDFIGGRGVNGKIMYDEMEPGINPLGAENIIVFGIGPLTGTLVPGSGRTDIMSKSPVTNFLGDSNMGGFWGAELKYAGYDNVLIKGKAENPVYISIDNEEVKILDASNIWGKDTYITPNIIRQELKDSEIKVLCIGKAGENKVIYSSILSGVKNASGRNGMGAVMGSKNLKAIAVRGTKGVKIANPDRFFAYCTNLHSLIKKASNYEEVTKRGAMYSQYMGGKEGYEPAGNFQIFDWDEKGKANPVLFWEKYGVRTTGCFDCPAHCYQTYNVPGIGGGTVSCVHYFEPIWKIKNDDFMLWWEIVRNCQIYGIDVISITGILAWLMELYENEIISEKDTDGIRMHWGNSNAIIKMMNKIINREGIGNILADGFKEATKQFGEKSEGYAMHVKNSPLMGASPRFLMFALGDALGPRGDYMRSYVPFARSAIKAIGNPNMSDEERIKMVERSEDQAEKITGTRKAANIMGYEGKAKALIYAEALIAIHDMLGICKNMGITNFQVTDQENLAEVFSAGLGKEIQSTELITAAERIRNVERAFEVREGLTRKDEIIPEREFNKEIGEPYKGVYLDRGEFEKAKDEYYSLRGWNIKTGIPTHQTLKNLGLSDIAMDLKKRKIISD